MKDQITISTDGKDEGVFITGVQYLDEHGYIPVCRSIIENLGNLRLVGNTGTGKTCLVHFLAQEMEGQLFEVSLRRDMLASDLIGNIELVNGNTRFKAGIILNWLRSTYKGYKILYCDAFNKGEPNIMSLTERLSDFRRSLHVTDLGKTFERTDKHIMVISYNPADKAGFTGTYMENIATLDRFKGLEIEYLSKTHEAKLLRKKTQIGYDWCYKWVALASKTRIAYNDGRLRMPLTTRDLLDFAILYKDGQSDDELIRIASSFFLDSEKETFLNLWEESKDKVSFD